MEFFKRILQSIKSCAYSNKTRHYGKIQSESRWNRNPQDGPHDLSKITQRAIDVFLMSKNQSNGEISGLSYWQTANGYTAIALRDAWENKTDNAAILNELISQIPPTHQGTFINSYNDDTMWWAMCLLESYRTQPDEHWYLDSAREIWTHVNQSVIPAGKYIVQGMDMDGGVLWTSNPDEDSVNSITTGLFAELSARLAVLQSLNDTADWQTSTDQLIDASSRSLNWIFRCRYREADNIVLDTVNINTNETVDWTFTYTTGQTIAACVALDQAISQTNILPSSNNPVSTPATNTADPKSYLALATLLTKKSLTRTDPAWLNANGILTESYAYGPENHNATQNDDAVGFKSVLIRSFAKYLSYSSSSGASADVDLGNEIKAFIFKQFEAVQTHDTVVNGSLGGDGSGQYGPWWDGPIDVSTSHSQMAVLDIMASVGLVKGISA